MPSAAEPCVSPFIFVKILGKFIRLPRILQLTVLSCRLWDGVFIAYLLLDTICSAAWPQPLNIYGDVIKKNNRILGSKDSLHVLRHKKFWFNTITFFAIRYQYWYRPFNTFNMYFSYNTQCKLLPLRDEDVLRTWSQGVTALLWSVVTWHDRIRSILRYCGVLRHKKI